MKEVKNFSFKSEFVILTLVLIPFFGLAQSKPKMYKNLDFYYIQVDGNNFRHESIYMPSENVLSEFIKDVSFSCYYDLKKVNFNSIHDFGEELLEKVSIGTNVQALTLSNQRYCRIYRFSIKASYEILKCSDEEILLIFYDVKLRSLKDAEEMNGEDVFTILKEVSF